MEHLCLSTVFDSQSRAIENNFSPILVCAFAVTHVTQLHQVPRNSATPSITKLHPTEQQAAKTAAQTAAKAAVVKAATQGSITY